METYFKFPLFFLLAFTAQVGLNSTQAFADENSNYGADWSHGQYPLRERSSFKLGVCVGQMLAAQGITLPAPSPGQPYLNSQTDTTNQGAIESAAQSCRAEFRGTTSSPQPSQAPSETPTAVPTESSSPAPSAGGN